jgi:hypothetical protein
MAAILAAAACSDPKSGTSGDPSGGIGGSGGSTTGGTNASGGIATGGTNTGGAVATGGTNATGGAVATGGTNATGGAVATGGAGAGSGGSNAGSGGSGTGGTSAGNGGNATGGTSAGSGGGGAGTGGATGGTGGSSSGATFHIFMLMGQSNMAGVAPRQASDANTDERMKIWGGCNQPQGQWNTVTNPPLNDCPGEKGWNLNNTVDPGIWFAKTLLPRLPAGDTIGLVGTAESGESINTFISGGSHHAMILRKISEVKTAPNARFAGIIFHQGESDSGQSSWPGKVVQLYNEVKAAWGVNFDVPFILGELPAGGCCAGHNNLIHQAAEMLPDGYWVSQMGTDVMDQYHFDHASVVLMGQRYGETMIEAKNW